MLAQLSNEHIPRVFDRFSDQNHHYLVMEFIDGITLEDRSSRTPAASFRGTSVIDVALQVLDTLRVPAQPRTAGDLSRSEAVERDADAVGQVKLIDFGIARLFQPLSNATMIGTQGYAPPEQYRGKVESRSDLYALGATMHHALSGRDPALEPPFSFPPLHTLCPDVTPALARPGRSGAQVRRRPADGRRRGVPERLMAIKSGTPMTVMQRKSGGGVARPQLKLPLSGVKSREQQASAPTMLSNAIDTDCPRCGRSIPIDSNYCSFCAADVTGRLPALDRGAHPEAQTIVLDDVASPGDFPGPIFHERRRRRHPARVMTLVIGGFFWSDT